MEDRPPIWRVAADKLNKQSLTADNGWPSSLGVGRDASSGDKTIRNLQEVGGGCADWMDLAQDRDRWRALVGTVMNLRVPKMRGIS